MAELDDLLAQVSDECCLLGGPEPFSPAGAGRAGYPCSHAAMAGHAGCQGIG